MENQKSFNKIVPTILTIIICLLSISMIALFVLSITVSTFYSSFMILLLVPLIIIIIIKVILYPSVKIYEDCFNIYCNLNEALQNGNIDPVAEFISPDVYNEYKEKEKYLKDNNIQYAFSPTERIKAVKSNDNNVVTLSISIMEFMLDSDNKIISGSQIPKLTTIDLGYSKDPNHFMCRCKECKTYYKDNNAKKCGKCGRRLAKDNYSVVITSINKKEA